MEKFIVEGQTRLKGEVTISGAKNAAVAIIPATILAQGKCVIENIPNISDISILFKILSGMGAKVRRINKSTVEVDTTYIGEPVVPYELARYMRASYYLLGTLLSRCNRASVSMPGGCNFGVRPIDQHMKGFEALGADVSIDSGMINACLLYTSASELEAYLAAVEEAKKRDHNIIGRQLKYFCNSDVVGQGLPLLMPKGAKLFQILNRYIQDKEEYEYGYLMTRTPLMAKSDLYKISGHWGHYKEGMFVLGDEEKDKEVFALRPMTCPFQYQVYMNDMHSYRDLPLRYGETSTLFRNEASGEMHGLIRVRQFTISEGHPIQMCIRDRWLEFLPGQGRMSNSWLRQR